MECIDIVEKISQKYNGEIIENELTTIKEKDHGLDKRTIQLWKNAATLESFPINEQNIIKIPNDIISELPIIPMKDHIENLNIFDDNDLGEIIDLNLNFVQNINLPDSEIPNIEISITNKYHIDISPLIPMNLYYEQLETHIKGKRKQIYYKKNEYSNEISQNLINLKNGNKIQKYSRENNIEILKETLISPKLTKNIEKESFENNILMVKNKIETEINKFKKINFEELYPKMNRLEIATNFYSLLILQSENKIQLIQKDFSNPIIINSL